MIAASVSTFATRPADGKAMNNWDDAVLVGVVARTHGHRGGVIVNSETDVAAVRVYGAATLLTRGKDGSLATFEVATMRMHQGRLVILFKGIGSMDDAELLAGLELRIPESDLGPGVLEDGEYYHRDL